MSTKTIRPSRWSVCRRGWHRDLTCRVAVRLAVDLVTKRIYDEPAGDDGARILVDGLWPRGMRKDDAPIDLWLRDVAPSADVRNAFRDKPEAWESFVEAYHTELDTNRSALEPIFEAAKKGKVTLLYGKRDTEHNNAVALLRYLQSSKRD